MFGHDITGIDFSPFSIRMANATESRVGRKSLATAQMTMPCSAWDAVRERRGEYVDALRKAYALTRGRSRACNMSLPCDAGKYHVFDCSQVESGVLRKLTDNPGFWRKHLGVAVDDYDCKRERVADKMLMTAIPLAAVEFYRELLGGAGLKLHALNLSCADYLCLVRASARRLLTVSPYEACFVNRTANSFDFKHIAIADMPLAPDMPAKLLDLIAAGFADDMRELRGDDAPVEVALTLPPGIGEDMPERLREAFPDIDFKRMSGVSAAGAEIEADMHRCAAISAWRMPARRRGAMLPDRKRSGVLATRAGWLVLAALIPLLAVWYFDLKEENRSLSPSFERQLEQAEQYSQLRLSEAKAKQKLAYWENLRKKSREVLDVRDAQPDFFRLLSAILPTKFRLDRAHCVRARSCRLSGVAPSYQAVVLFLKELEKSPAIARASLRDVSGVGDGRAMKFLIECDYAAAASEAAGDR